MRTRWILAWAEYENNSWLGIYDLFQTFEDLDSVKDKPAEVEAIRQLIDEEVAEGEEGLSC